MLFVHTASFYLHLAAGSLALVVFWLPVFARKGSPFHRRAGRWFANGMYAVSVTGLVMSLLVIMDPVGVRFPARSLDMENAFELSRRARMFSLFLLMLSVLVFASVRHAILVLRVREDRAVLRRPAHFVMMLTLGVLGVAVGIIGVRAGELLLMIFSVLSIATAVNMLRYSFKAELFRNEWWIEHLANIIGAGIGAYTAFFAFGGRRLFGDLLTGQLQVIPWVLPSIIGVFFTVRLSRAYRRRFAPREQPVYDAQT